ncbi:hypothetical protein HDV05_007600, partial [Chytridiales sp. JEL 0842]
PSHNNPHFNNHHNQRQQQHYSRGHTILKEPSNPPSRCVWVSGLEHEKDKRAELLGFISKLFLPKMSFLRVWIPDSPAEGCLLLECEDTYDAVELLTSLGARFGSLDFNYGSPQHFLQFELANAAPSTVQDVSEFTSDVVLGTTGLAGLQFQQKWTVLLTAADVTETLRSIDGFLSLRMSSPPTAVFTSAASAISCLGSLAMFFPQLSPPTLTTNAYHLSKLLANPDNPALSGASTDTGTCRTLYVTNLTTLDKADAYFLLSPLAGFQRIQFGQTNFRAVFATPAQATLAVPILLDAQQGLKITFARKEPELKRIMELGEPSRVLWTSTLYWTPQELLKFLNRRFAEGFDKLVFESGHSWVHFRDVEAATTGLEVLNGSTNLYSVYSKKFDRGAAATQGGKSAVATPLTPPSEPHALVDAANPAQPASGQPDRSLGPIRSRLLNLNLSTPSPNPISTPSATRLRRSNSNSLLPVPSSSSLSTSAPSSVMAFPPTPNDADELPTPTDSGVWVSKLLEMETPTSTIPSADLWSTAAANTSMSALDHHSGQSQWDLPTLSSATHASPPFLPTLPSDLSTPSSVSKTAKTATAAFDPWDPFSAPPAATLSTPTPTPSSLLLGHWTDKPSFLQSSSGVAKGLWDPPAALTGGGKPVEEDALKIAKDVAGVLRSLVGNVENEEEEFEGVEL